MSCVIEVVTFNFPDFKMNKSERRRLRSIMNVHLHEGRLTRDPIHEKQWLGALLVHRVTTAYAQDALANGTFNWDTVLLRILSVVLQSVLGCRAGDLARSQHYKGLEYMRFEHIQMKLVQFEGKEIIQAQIVLRYAKGSKYA